MKPTKKQNLVINSSADLIIFGFSAGCGKTETLKELSKRYLQKPNTKTLFILSTSDSARYIKSHQLESFYKNLGFDFKITENTVYSENNSELHFKIKADTQYDVLLVENANHLSRESLQELLDISRKRFMNMNPDTDSYLSEYVKPFLNRDMTYVTEINAGKTKTVNNIKTTCIPMSPFENPYLGADYIDCLKSMANDEVNRLVNGRFKTL